MAARPGQQGRGLLLPSVRTTYDESFNVYKPLATPVDPLPPPPMMPDPLPPFAAPPMPYGPSPQVITVRDDSANPRFDVLEDRLAAQELRTRALLDRALRIKQDIVEALNYTQGTWQNEKQARELLQEHIKAITAVVKQLHRDLEGLQEDIKHRDYASGSTNNALKNLETHHIAGITDIRNRIARCDASIARLASDLKSLVDEQRHVSQQHVDADSRLGDKLQALEARIVDLHQRQERVAGEAVMRVKGVEGEASKALSLLDSRTRAVVDDLKNAITNVQILADSEREKLETRLIAHIEKENTSIHSRIDKLDKSLSDMATARQARVESIESDVRHMKDQISQMNAQIMALSVPRVVTGNNGPNFADIEMMIQTKLTEAVRKQEAELARLKRESREGFATVHETVANMNKVIEGKRTLLEEQLRKELAQLRKMVVLI